MAFDTTLIRQQFPLLHQRIDEHPIVYLDSAATAQMPQAVLDAMEKFETSSRSNVHRGMHQLADQATEQYEAARQTVQGFLHAAHAHEIVFTKNATEAVNLVARSWGPANIAEGNLIILPLFEHHSNIVPWQQLAGYAGCAIAWLGIDQEGNIDMEQYRALLGLGAARLVAVSGQSNVLGTQPPLKEMIELAHEADVPVLVDASQLVSHQIVDVQELDCDFLVLSGHKLYGPTGIGALYAKQDILKQMQPFLGGGSMIHDVDQEGFTPAEIPQRFEAGTPPITQAIGLAAAIQWLGEYAWEDLQKHESHLLTTAHNALSTIDGLQILGPQDPTTRSGCISFTIEGVHPHDLTDLLGQRGFCLRAGHHCCQPLHDFFEIPATTRLSVGVFNTEEEITTCADQIKEIAHSLIH